jgi:glycosyltransferase involved in cell wall biosynthesis
MKPRVLLVGRTRYRLPLNVSLQRKFAAIGAELDTRVLGSAADDSQRGDETFSLVRRFPVRVLDGALFWSLLPLRVARQLRRFEPDAVLAQSAYDGAAAMLGRTLARSPARVVVDVHGDWRTATRLYGSPLRRVLAPVGDRISLAAIRRADAVRSVSGYTLELVRAAGREPDDVFPAFMDLDVFLAEPPAPLPERPQALFVGVLEHYKGIEELAAAWRLAAPRVPAARLLIVGSGSRAHVIERLVAELPDQTSWTRTLTPEEVAAALDGSTVLVLPSRSEGMGRVVVEARCRGRAVVGTRVGGIPDLIRDGEQGLLVEPRDPVALADAIVRVLANRELATRLGSAARRNVEELAETPEKYAARLRSLVERTLLNSET